VLLLPFYLERALNIGALACLDAWLYTFTILPMRFCVALGVLVKWWMYMIGREVRFVVGFVWYGLGRLWARGRQRDRDPATEEPDLATPADERARSLSKPRGTMSRTTSANTVTPVNVRRRSDEGGSRPALGQLRMNGNGHAASFKRPTPSIGFGGMRHRRTKSMPSNLSSFHKADLLQGLIIIASSMFLMNLDASRMYHVIRAQSAIKLYAIYNLLEVCCLSTTSSLAGMLTNYTGRRSAALSSRSRYI